MTNSEAMNGSDHPDGAVKRIVIVGGGSAGWMAAAMFSTLLGTRYDIKVIESEEIGIIGVGEATIPAVKTFNTLLNMNEAQFMKDTQGTFKLGIEFVNWKSEDHSYIHGFGKIGQDMKWIRMHHYWLKMLKMGKAPHMDRMSVNTWGCRENKFMMPRTDMPDSPLADIYYAYHFDASLYARYLRGKSESQGVTRLEGKIVEVKLRSEDGFIKSVVMQDGEEIEADFFVDCSGIRALLIGQALGSEYVSWNHWLVCNRAWAMPCESAGELTPYTRSTAHKSGWQWRIPLQHRTGNGHVFSNHYISEDEAASVLINNLDGKAIKDPMLVRFEPGVRSKGWVKNCVAIGLSSGFLEPLESTSIHLIHSAIMRVINLFPSRGFSQIDIDEYNSQSQFEYERIRDFIIAHYKVTEREDSPMWQYCKHMPIPDTLKQKLDLFAENARFFKFHHELFVDESWVQVLIGQGLIPRGYDPNVDLIPLEKVENYLKNIEEVVAKCVNVMPRAADFVADFCPASS